jgi:hypothetical protein
MDAPAAPSRLRRRLLRTGLVLATLLVLYTALGFLAAPALLRRLLVDKASAALQRPVAIERVKLNPLAFSVAVDGFSATERDGAPFLSWASLYLRLSPHRLLVGELGLAEIRLVRPSLEVGLLADGSLSFQDLLGSSEPAPPAEPAAEGDGIGLSIGRLAIEEARVAFRDATRRPAFKSLLGPLTVRLESFRTKGGGDSPYSFTGTTDAGETFRWTGTVRTQPIRSSGTLTFEKIALPRYGAYLHDAAPVDLLTGLLELETRYELEWGPQQHVMRLEGGKVVVTDLAVALLAEDDPPVKLPRIEVSGVEVDAVARAAKVAAVALRGGALRVRRGEDHALELLRLAPVAGGKPAAAAAPAWTWEVGVVEATGLAVTWEDRVPQPPVALRLSDVSVRLSPLKPGKEARSDLALSLGWPGGGKVSLAGAVQPLGDTGALDLQAADLDLVPMEPYLKPDLAASLTGGRAGAKATIGYDLSGAAVAWTFAGDARLDGLAVAEQGNPDLLRWKSLEVNGIDAGSTPPHALVRQVRLTEPRAKVYVWEDGTTSIARARGAPPAAPAAASAEAAPAPAWKTAIANVEVAGGRASFVDRSVRPAAVVNLTRATAKVARLSSDPGVRSTVDVRLEVEGASPIRVTGTLNPLQHGAYTDLAVASQGVDLSPLGPYSGKYLGYGLQKGKLDLDLRYKIEDRNLASTNVVRIDQLTLGERTDSPDATRIPVRLALALLRDRDGVILLDVPIEGKLDDPEFRLGKVIWHTILNVLVKVATSPFSALAALVGGGERELSAVEFTPGTAALAPDAAERLASLGKSLAQRPALELEVEGTADEQADGEALRRAAVERALRRAKAAGMKPAPASDDEVTVSPEERPRLLRAAHAAAFPPPPAAAGAKAAEAASGAARAEPSPEPTEQELEEQLAAAMEVAPDAYTSLASERAQRARVALIEAGIDQARLFLAQGSERAAKEKGARAYFNVK